MGSLTHSKKHMQHGARINNDDHLFFAVSGIGSHHSPTLIHALLTLSYSMSEKKNIISILTIKLENDLHKD